MFFDLEDQAQFRSYFSRSENTFGAYSCWIKCQLLMERLLRTNATLSIVLNDSKGTKTCYRLYSLVWHYRIIIIIIRIVSFSRNAQFLFPRVNKRISDSASANLKTHTADIKSYRRQFVSISNSNIGRQAI